MRPFVSGLDPRRCGERFMPAPANTGNGWSAIRSALEQEADYLRMAETAERNDCPHTARKFRADAAAAIARFRQDRVSTFPGEPAVVSPNQERLF